ncbi:undecaprenyl diphosphate synthase family protein [Kitasatospora sp. NPDC089509]|uniref:undecaprenyl diphosphate synthase family protein n=1 Tax=Kitasatospora sp. NPDC089509 TaxID=3364079 RepID=UPI0037F4C43E
MLRQRSRPGGRRCISERRCRRGDRWSGRVRPRASGPGRTRRAAGGGPTDGGGDRVIRTSGEQRLSGFMPRQTAHAELYFTPVPWPAFDRESFDAALQWYRTREKRYGL